jgi:hypothetical protein
MVLDYCPPLRISRVRLLMKDMKIITQSLFSFFLQELYTEDHVDIYHGSLGPQWLVFVSRKSPPAVGIHFDTAPSTMIAKVTQN